jgi:hypothetical protein
VHAGAVVVVVATVVEVVADRSCAPTADLVHEESVRVSVTVEPERDAVCKALLVLSDEATTCC